MNTFKNIAKVTAGALLISILSGCTGSNQWINIPYQEANSWRGIGVSSYDARNYRKMDLHRKKVQNGCQKT
jgi:hypothetical protein